LTFSQKHGIIIIETERKEMKIMQNKTLVLDMDGTFVDLYGVENWLEDLRSFNPRPYVEAKPLVDLDSFIYVLELLRGLGWRIAITTWLSKESTKEYDDLVRNAKLEWLERNGVPFDEIHLVKYGTTKANCTRKLGGYQVLADDNAQIRKGWTLGTTIDANKNLLGQLVELLLADF
jgi:hypothetical protein